MTNLTMMFVDLTKEHLRILIEWTKSRYFEKLDLDLTDESEVSYEEVVRQVLLRAHAILKSGRKVELGIDDSLKEFVLFSRGLMTRELWDQRVCLTITHSLAPPAVKTFLIMFYGDQFFFRLLSTWQISLHSCNRLSIQTIQGQAIKIPLPLKLESLPDPYVQLFGSHSSIRIDPPNAVLGSTFKDVEPPVAIFTPDKRIDQVLMVTAVDQSLKQLLFGWLIYVNVKEPNITKSYNVSLPVGGTKVITRKIALENQYNIEQKFRVHSSDENLVILSQEYYDVAPNQAASLVLCFQPVVESPMKKEVLLFVENAATFHQEEAYLVQITYDYA
ncbi:hypothetical protein L596_028819 [Steinernema carpocapsae]|uniref:Uncharacterized protein n=1 Tax=Steinernema carpocapsae TaxID=34508 RepID=A0A4U5LZH7_STECR|nr:hypothetical protein L596_028819 [Steinernema carpocapsae]